MEQYVIIEKLKEFIGEKKVKAAVFYTYNFDARFFENYVLTKFLPHVQFSDHEIQNTILWRKYMNDIPPVTVYCDFHAKKPDAPSLKYEVKLIDLPKTRNRKPCFHPKVSFILLEDWSLIVINGSNNLSEGGWCTNKEIIDIQVLKNGENFPYHQKHELWGFFKSCIKLTDENIFKKDNWYNLITEAERYMDDFLRQRLHTDNNEFKFYYSGQQTFINFLKRLLAECDEEKFQYAEIISPYISTGTGLLEEFIKELMDSDEVYINIPYKAINEADITEENYNAFKDLGVKWSCFVESDNEKTFRFNHSKLYRFYTEKVVFTIIGSVNFTEAAWSGFAYTGNMESAIVHTNNVEDCNLLLQECTNPDVIFTSEPSDETKHDDRIDAPDFGFELDWLTGTLKYNNYKKFNFNGEFVLDTKGNVFKEGTNVYEIKENEIEALANNPVIRVNQYQTGISLYYYPVQKNIENKPLPQKLKLKDAELIELWNHVSIDEDRKSELTELIVRFISDRLSVDDDLKEENTRAKSILNLMASHISALIHLDERIFPKPNSIKKKEYALTKEMNDYYLFASNIDTLNGYRNLLKEMHNNKQILPGVYWFLSQLLINNFYDDTKIRHFYKGMNYDSIGLGNKLKPVLEEIQKVCNKLRKEFNTNRFNESEIKKLLDWVSENI